MTLSYHAPNVVGDTRATMAGEKGRDPARWATQKIHPKLELHAATRLHEAEITSNRQSSIQQLILFPYLGKSLEIMPACVYTSARVYWIFLMAHMHQTLHLAHVILLSFLCIFHGSVRFNCIDHFVIVSYIEL